MRHISKETKEIILKKVLEKGDETIVSIAKANGIGRSTLHRWLMYSQKGEATFDSKIKTNSNNKLSRPEKFHHLMETAHLDELSVGAYCRKHGLYSHQLQQWSTSFMCSDELGKKANDKMKLKVLEVENKKLKQDLRRKEKALAEASALLVMKKKAALIWGEVEDD